MAEVEQKIKIITEYTDNSSTGIAKTKAQVLDFSKAAEKAGKDIGKNLSEGTDKANESAKSLTSSFMSLKSSTIVTAAAIGTVVAAATKMVKAYAESDLAIKKLNDSLKVADVFSESYSKHLQNQALAIQKTTRFSDEQVMSVQQLLVTYGVYGEMLDKTVKASIDLAEVTDKDVNGAAFALSKAIQGNTEMLSRYGIKIDESIPKSERFAKAIEQIQTKMGGRAAGAGETLSGSLTIARNSLGELLEKGGEWIVAATSMVKIVNSLADGFTKFRIAMHGGNEQEETQRLISGLMQLEDTIQKRSVGLVGKDAENAAIQLKKVHAQILELIGKKQKMEKLDRESVETATKKSNAIQDELKKTEALSKWKEAHKDDRQKFEDLKRQAESERGSAIEQISTEYQQRVEAINKLTGVEKQERIDLINFEYELRDKKIQEQINKEFKERQKKADEQVSSLTNVGSSLATGSASGVASGVAGALGATAAMAGVYGLMGELVINSKEIPGKIAGLISGLAKGIGEGIPILINYLSTRFIPDLVDGLTVALSGLIKSIPGMAVDIGKLAIRSSLAAMTGGISEAIGGLFGWGDGPSPMELLADTMRKLSEDIKELNKNLNQNYRDILSSVSGPSGQLNIAKGDFKSLSKDQSELRSMVKKAAMEGNVELTKSLLKELADTQADMMNKAKEIYDLESANATKIYDKKKELYQKERQLLVDRINELKTLRSSAIDSISKAREAILSGSSTAFQNVDRLRQNFRMATTGEGKSEAASALASGLQSEFEAAKNLAAQGAISGEEFSKIKQGILNELDATQSQVQSEFGQLIDVQKQQIKVLSDGFQKVTTAYNKEMAKLRDALLDVAKSLKNLPKYAQGTNYVPNTGLALLHQGEQVVPKGMNPGNITINVSGGSGTNQQDLVKAIRDIFKSNQGNLRGLVNG